jgi:hypothetical protein
MCAQSLKISQRGFGYQFLGGGVCGGVAAAVATWVHGVAAWLCVPVLPVRNVQVSGKQLNYKCFMAGKRASDMHCQLLSCVRNRSRFHSAPVGASFLEVLYVAVWRQQLLTAFMASQRGFAYYLFQCEVCK